MLLFFAKKGAERCEEDKILYMQKSILNFVMRC